MNFTGSILCPIGIVLIEENGVWCYWPEQVHYTNTLSGIHSQADSFFTNMKKKSFFIVPSLNIY